MHPRLKKSKKWTAFPEELNDQIRTAIEENFSQELKNAQVVAEGRIYPLEVLLRVGFLEVGALRQKNFEISCEYRSDKGESAADKIYIAVDAAASLLLDYFEKEKTAGDDALVEPPLTWTELKFENHTVHFQFSTVNSKLESEADRILGIQPGKELLVDEEGDFDETAEFDDEPETDDEGSESGKKLH